MANQHTPPPPDRPPTTVTRATIYERFSSPAGKPVWWTLADMARKVEDVVPPEVAVRTYLWYNRGARAKNKSPAQQVVAGRLTAVREALDHMVTDGVAERRKTDGLAEYYVPPKRPPAYGRAPEVATADDLTRPADTKTGLSVPILKLAVSRWPNKTMAELAAHLAPCFRDAGCYDLLYSRLCEDGRNQEVRDRAVAKLKAMSRDEIRERVLRWQLGALATRGVILLEVVTIARPNPSGKRPRRQRIYGKRVAKARPKRPPGGGFNPPVRPGSPGPG